MRRDLDAWDLFLKTENLGDSLSRFMIAFDELRARLAPSKYPNFEISDEGCLWFNVDTSIGTVEIVGIVFDFKELEGPSVIVSFPRKAKDVELNFLKRLHRISLNINGGALFAGFSPPHETLKAYRHNMQPPLTITQKLEKILDIRRKDVFFNYLGVSFGVSNKKVSEVESIIKNLLFEAEQNSSKEMAK